MTPRAGTDPRRAKIACSITLVCWTIESGEPAVLLCRAGDGWTVPRDPFDASASIERGVASLIRRTLGGPVHWHEQVGAFPGAARDGDAHMSIVFAAVVAQGTSAPPAAAWHRLGTIPARTPQYARQWVMSALARLRSRVGETPLAFHLVPERFTLGELQAAYEAVLGRPLHKASFRRTLARARLVRPSSARTAGGAGRPSRLYVFAPPRASRAIPLRFDLSRD